MFPAPPPLPGTPPPPSSHRLSRNAIIAIVVVAVLIIGGAAIAFAAFHKGTTTPTPGIPPALPSASASPSAPARFTPRPSASATAAPSGRPTSAPGPSGAGTTVDTAYATIFVPAGFNDQGTSSSGGCQSNTLSSDKNGLVIFGSCQLPAGATKTDFDQALLQSDQQALDPGAKLCSPNKPSPLPLTASGGTLPADEVSICLDVKPTSGAVFHATDFYFTAVGRKADGSSVGVFVNLYAPADEFKAYADSVPDAVITKTIFKDVAP